MEFIACSNKQFEHAVLFDIAKVEATKSYVFISYIFIYQYVYYFYLLISTYFNLFLFIYLFIYLLRWDVFLKN